MPLPSELIERLADAGARRELGRLLDALAGAAPLKLERGVWTPSWAGSSTAGAYTYGVQRGDWARLDPIVWLSLSLRITAIGTPPAGVMRLLGLPFSANPLSERIGGVCFSILSQLDLSAGKFALTGRIGPGSNFVDLWESADNAGVAAWPATQFTNAACYVSGFGMYWV